MHHPATKRRRSLLLAVAPLALVLAAGCGTDTDSDTRATPSATEHNDADVAFATDMVQHHAQALAMVNLTTGRTVGPEFTALAERILEAQGPEIETMVDWLDEWGEEVPETVNDHMNHDMGTVPEGTEDMPGMMSANEMDELENAPDAEFEKLWLEMMTRHHEGAVEMAKAEEDDGQYKPAIDLAQAIISSQRAEIDEMKDLLAAP